MKSYVNPLRNVPSDMNGHRVGLDEKNYEVFFTSCSNGRGKYFAMGFVGKGKKNSFYYSFTSEEKMYAHIEGFIQDCELVLGIKKAKKEERKERNSKVKCEVGQLFRYSWGYDQTNVDFYQVIEVKGKKVFLKEVGYTTVEGSQGFMFDRVKPTKDDFVGRGTILVKILKSDYNGNPTFSMDCGSLTLTSEDQDTYRSWYA